MSVNGACVCNKVRYHRECCVCVTCATIDRMPTTPIKTAMVVEEKFMTWRDGQKILYIYFILNKNLKNFEEHNSQHVDVLT